jgi:hypothetical protein
VVILGCFHADQDQVLKDSDAIRQAVRNAAGWVKERGYTNVVLEVANDSISKAYDHQVIKDPVGMAELIGLAKKAAPGLLVSASGGGGGRLDRRVSTAADFLLIHFDTVPVTGILSKVAAGSKVAKAIVCNQDPKTGEQGAQALEEAVNSAASWGYANFPKNERYPFHFEGAADDPPVYAKFREVTKPQ